ncbi:unnamed protein product [Durusdinium trenchii]|uniref:Phytanoyl-dioxygenase n=1 Tax=Durusdinium trenchii TaxID=1381693 RepID=A0ABP0S1K2_9DINO
MESPGAGNPVWAPGLGNFISAGHWHWQLAELAQALELRRGDHVAAAPVAAAGAVDAVRPAAQALSSAAGGDGGAWAKTICWEPSVGQLRQLRQRMANGGRVVAAARPWRAVDWPAASRPVRWSPQSEERLCKNFLDAGFELLQVRVCCYPCEITWTAWLNVLEKLFPEHGRQRSTMADPEGERYLHFDDRLLLVTAQLPNPAWHLALEGFWAPLLVLQPWEAQEVLEQLDAHAQQVIGSGAKVEDLQGEQRFKVHLLYPWAARLVRHPVLVSAVQKALGTQDVLLWFSEVNAKAPMSKCHAAPHQDGIFASLWPNDAVCSVFVALTDATAEMGGLFFQRGSHLRGQLPHIVDGEAQNLIGFKCEEANQVFDSDEAVPVELKAGEASLHTFRTLHWSGPNLTSTRRVGLALRYVRADVARSRPLRRRESATVAAGRYDARRGAFDVEMEPRRALGEEEVKCHQEALARERENYCADEV